MIIENSPVNAGNFIYCPVYFGPNETYVYLNGGDGHHHQYTYVVDGQAEVKMSLTPDGEPVYFNNSDSSSALFNHEQYKGMYHTITTTNRSLSIINFNPIPETRQLDVEILKGPLTQQVVANDKRITIVCITGPITANDKTLASLQYAKLFPGKTAELTLSESSVVALVSDN